MPIKVDRRGQEKILKDLDDSLTNRKDRFITAKFIVKMIVKRTRDEARGVKRTGANKSKLKDVSPEWATQRAKAKGKHSKAASGNKSNLTFRGTMLDKLTVLKATDSKMFIGWQSQKEADKAQGNADRGRPFMFLSRGEITKTSDFIKKQILKNI